MCSRIVWILGYSSKHWLLSLRTKLIFKHWRARGNRLSKSHAQIRKAINSCKHDYQIAPYFPQVFLLKSKRLKPIKFVKVETHQEDVKSFERLSLLEQLNVKCDARVNTLMLSALEDEVAPFPLKLSSRWVMIAANHLMLNHPKDLRLRVRLIKCEDRLKNTQDTQFVQNRLGSASFNHH